MYKRLSISLVLLGLAMPAFAQFQPPINYTLSTSASVGTTSGQLIPPGAAGNVLQICTLPGSGSNVWLNPVLNGTAVVDQGIPVWANGGCAYFGPGGWPMPKAGLQAITDGVSSQTVSVVGG
jgi:hypothetical protein